MSNQDEEFMRRAIELSRQTSLVDSAGGVFGAVIVKDGAIIAEGANRVVAENDPTWHGEMEAIRKACKALGSFKLTGPITSQLFFATAEFTAKEGTHRVRALARAESGEPIVLDPASTLVTAKVALAAQARRLDDRRDDPLKQLKVSDLDAEAQRRWKDYTKARDEMLKRTSTPISPWLVVHTDDKKQARLNVIRHLLHALAPADIAGEVELPDPAVLFPFEETALTDGRLFR